MFCFCMVMSQLGCVKLMKTNISKIVFNDKAREIILDPKRKTKLH